MPVETRFREADCVGRVSWGTVRVFGRLSDFGKFGNIDGSNFACFRGAARVSMQGGRKGVDGSY